MTLPIPDRRHTLGALGDALARYTTLLRNVSDPSRTAIGEWSIGETAAHTSHSASVFVELLQGGRSPVEDHRQMSDVWKRQLELDAERDPKVIADRLQASVGRFVELATEERWAEVIKWHGDIKAPVYMLGCTFVTELEVHGLDIATAEDKPWKVSAPHALLAIQGLLPVLHHFVDADGARGLRATFELDLRGAGPLFFRVEDGELAVSQEQPGSVDCRIKADPTTYLLVGYGRRSQWGPILTGKIMALGRKPWLALRFGKLFVSP